MASWTTPISANVGDVYTAAWYNTHTRDNLNSLQGFGIMGQPVGTESFTLGVANVAVFVRVWAMAKAVTSFEASVNTSAGNIDVGIYTDSAGAPAARLWSRGSIVSPGTGQQTILISAGSPSSLTMTSGPCWLAMSASSTSFKSYGANNSPKGYAKQATSSHPLPSTVSSPTDTTGAIAAILL